MSSSIYLSLKRLKGVRLSQRWRSRPFGCGVHYKPTNFFQTKSCWCFMQACDGSHRRNLL